MTDLGNGLFAVKANLEDNDFYISGLNHLCCYKPNNYRDVLSPAFDVEVEILGTVTASDISFDVEPYVQKRTLGYWLDYTKPNTRHDYMCDTPKDSFRSLLSSKGLYFENPYGIKPNICDYGSRPESCMAYFDDMEDWQQAQNNLIEKLVIIKKV